MDGCSVRVLGPVEVRISDRAVELAGRRQRALLAALVLGGGRSVPVSELIDAVWGEDPPERARTTVQTYVSRLRRLLGPDAIRHEPAGYRLDGVVDTDLAALHDALRTLERLGPGDHERRVATALGALGSWRGRALAEFEEVDFFRGEAVRLSETRADLVDVAAQHLIALSRASQAIPLLETSVGEHPFRETTWALLVDALHAAGRSTDAVRAAARYRRDLREETGLLPGPALARAEAAALAGEPAPATIVDDGLAEWSTTSLARPTPLIGRGTEMEALRSLVGRERMVTVTGVGGVGKTRLVAELAADHPTRVVTVELAPVSFGAVVSAVGAAFGYRAPGGDERSIADLLHDHEVLIVLDNAEHVIGEVRRLARTLVDRCPGVRILTTSRQRLDHADEVVMALQPLRTTGPDPAAATLFLDRLQRARPDGTADGDAAELLDLCRRVDGVPLAIELAASRAAVLGVPALNERLTAFVGSLVDVRPAEGRHATLGNVVSWSVELLDDPARDLLCALSVFHGPFDLDAAEAIGAAAVDGPTTALLARLVDASLVSTTAEPARYRMLEMVRGFAAERLRRAGDAERVHRAHAEWVARRAEEIDARSVGPGERDTVARYDAIRHEARAALRSSIEGDDIGTASRITSAIAGPALYRPDAELVEAIRWVASIESLSGAVQEPTALAAGARAAFLLGDLRAVDRLAHRALDRTDPADAAHHRALHALGVVRLYQGRFVDAGHHFAAVASSPAVTVVDRLDALGGLGLAQCYAGRVDAAQRTVDEHRGLAATTGSETYLAFAEYVQGEIRLARGDVELAGDLLRSASDRAWDARAAFVWGIASTVLAGVLVRHRPPAEARRHLPVLLERWRHTATWPQLWTTLRLVAEHLAVTDEPTTALLILAAAEHDPAAPHLAGDDAARERRLRASLTAALGEATASGIVAGAGGIERGTLLRRALALIEEPLERPAQA